ACSPGPREPITPPKRRWPSSSWAHGHRNRQGRPDGAAGAPEHRPPCAGIPLQNPAVSVASRGPASRGPGPCRRPGPTFPRFAPFPVLSYHGGAAGGRGCGERGHGMELGIYSFAEMTPDRTGRLISPEERLRNLLEEIELADQVGLDVFGVGEHHRPDFAVSAPAVVLAAAAARTRRIRLTSAVNVLSSDDPVRVFQQFATLD